MNTIIPFENKQLDYSIGWFRLHEAALKNEHERAFLNYRLLMHSYDHKGFQYQVQGDLHLLFSEYELAIESYQKAFLIYFYNEEYLYAILMNSKIKKLNAKVSPDEENKLNTIVAKNIHTFSLFFK